MKRFLIVVDMQKEEAQAMLPRAVERIRGFRDGAVIATMDTHEADYLDTAEGQKLPVVHCVRGTEGWQLDKSIAAALRDKEYAAVEKTTFGSMDLPRLIEKAAEGEDFSVELIGLCTDICVVSNAQDE